MSTVDPRALGKTLLIVEDDKDIREALDGLLSMEGYQVAGCANGLEALQYLRRSPAPDVILLDLMMPVMDGWQFRVEQKKDPALASIPVVALSADNTPKAAAIDAEAYLKKPVDFDTLLGTIERLVLRLDHQRLQAKLAQTDRLTSLGTLAAGVAHEINNPLAYVLLNLTFIAEQLPQILGPLPGEREKQISLALEHAKGGAERIRSIVRGLKTFSRPEDESRVPVDVREVMESSISMVLNEIRHRAKLVRDLAPVPKVDANEARLGQVFLNLLLNAAQALPEGKVGQNEIRVSTRRTTANTVLVEVADTGCGIPESIRGRIFEPFFTTKPVGIGTGLGLAICHGVITSLDGKLSVDSEVGKGSVFRVELPTSESATSVRDPASSKRTGGARKRVLIIDDEPIICFTLERLLANEHQVVAVTSGAEALARLQKGERYDLILCDLMMPDMDGADVYEAIRTFAPDQAERMVFVTGGAFTPRGQEFLHRVTNPRVEKPFDVDALLGLIRERLN
jgi:signal transduction histidine kinase